MHRIILTAAACLLLTACGTKDFDAGLQLRLPPFPDGETSHYQVVTPAGVIGEHRTGVGMDWLEDIPVYRLILVTRTMTGNIETTDSSMVLLHQPDLRPLFSFRFVTVGEALTTTATIYREGSVAVSTWTHTGEEKQQLLPSGAGTYDAEQLAFLGRAVRPNPKRPAEITVVEPMGPPFGGDVRPGEFRALGDETVTVPAGSFDCRKLGLTVGDSEFELWYEKAGTGRLVRRLALESGVAIELMPSPPRQPEPRQDLTQ
ncbi:MAG TPA: DUF3108 domain-containing protein [candidate division WOR-3 bacterium]|uniref:DUF3108 domain-containing protein n=1 Tax=candidate division WOR-3 bacterium TaxID=2052148 RepID=A0A7V0XFU1_UNCW3|nr:DUF3108 domain-containing protein [candidate division WOR-3 bacterium]